MSSGQQEHYSEGIVADVHHIYHPKKTDPLSPGEVAGYICPICGKILRNPQQASCCGRRYCRVCVDGLRRKFGPVFNCPQCGARIGDSSNDNYTFTDQNCRNDLKRFVTICCTKPRCNWKGLLLEIEQHTTECGNVIIECTLHCGTRLMRRELQNHLITDCELRSIKCHFCKENVQVLIFQEHLLDCKGKKDSTCPFCEEKCLTNAELHEHVHSGRCTKALLSCPVRTLLNCNVKVKPTNLMEHYITHMTQVIKDNVQQKAEVQGELDTLRRKCASQENELMRYEEDMKMLKQNIEKQAAQHKIEIQSLQESIQALSGRVSNLPAIQHSGAKSSDLSHMEGTVRTLQHNVDSLTRQVQTINSKVEENSEQAGALQTGIDQCTTAINQVNGLLNEVGLKVDILAVRSINGILIWKVNEVEKRIEEARTSKILSLYSPPFFTSLHGYRMCLRLYLDGDGQGKGTHVSLFLVIMKSDYDDLLSWPFKQKVTLYLLNQHDPYNTRAHIAQAFRPTETSTSFQKPKGPFNTASGFPRFAPIAKLYDRSYVQDDCMYFKVKIDMTDLKAPDYPAY